MSSVGGGVGGYERWGGGYTSGGWWKKMREVLLTGVAASEDLAWRG